jgi:DNA helicase-2/ATP-dependent DNA helicase PcrA
MAECEARKKSLWTVIRNVAQGNIKTASKLSQQAITGLEDFTNIILTAHHKLAQPQTCVGDMLSHVMQKTKYESFLRDTYKQEYEDRAANVDELVQLAQSGRVFAEQEEELIEIDGVEQQMGDAKGPSEALAQFLANIALATDADKKDAENKSEDKVVISTIHAAKGLEWPVVFIPAVYQGSIPHSRAEDVDEERRLLYVGMTRAKALLYLSWPKKNSASECTIRSPFLSTPTITRYYESKGPSFGWAVSKELARILGRECPSSKVVDACHFSVGAGDGAGIRLRDDEFPEDGEELQEQSTYLRETYTAEELEVSYGGLSKKRKMDHLSYKLRTEHMAVTTSIGFISAREVKVRVERPSQVQGKPIISQAATSKPTKPSRGRKKVENGQASINSFFTKSSTAPFSMTDTIVKNTKSTGETNRQNPSLPQRNTMWKQNATAPLSSTPRKLQKLPSFGRPQFDDVQTNGEPGGHILLSSSPPKTEQFYYPMAKNRGAKEDARAGKENSQEALEENKLLPVEFSKASTMHQTSMQKISGAQSRPGVRMTIGVRPTLSGNVNTKFRPPSMR